MSIVSWRFAGFVTLVLAVYHLLPRRAQSHWLLVASYAFYWLCAPQFLLVLLGVTLASFAVGRQLEKGKAYRTHWLWSGIGINLMTLVAMRYAYRKSPFAGPFIVAGLSFYSLQAISYLLDLYSGKLKGRGTLADVALYLAYFPKLVAGPIERAHAFLPRLGRPNVVNEEMLASALTLIVIGVTRKVVIADPLAGLLPTDAFSSPSQFSAAVLAGSLVGYSFFLYNDFAGYTSIVRGVSRLFGIELSANFAQPIFSRNFTEFWNRWHITLSYWMRDYIYLPLSRALLRRNLSMWNVPNLILPPMVTMVASGLWHGDSSNMVVWGGLHGIYLIVERVISLWRPAPPIHKRAAWRQVAGACIVFALGMLAFVWFRMPSAVALDFWRRLLSATMRDLPDARILAFIVPSLWLDWMQYRHGEETAFSRWPRVCRAALLAVAILLCFLMTREGTRAPFVYQGF